MTNLEVTDFPLDPALVAEIDKVGLVVERVDDADREAVAGWQEAVARGFLDAERSEAQRTAFFRWAQGRRKLGVYDRQAPIPEQPVATFVTWSAQLSVPGGMLPSYAVSGVTVAPTHRRRGLLRALMTSELRSAAHAGYPISSLTVSEAGIYGRFGFAPAAFAVQAEINVRRAGWVGPRTTGRVDFLSRAQGRALAAELHDRVRSQRPGEVNVEDRGWDEVFGTSEAAEKAGELRVVQYRSAAGRVDGLAVYTVAENIEDYAASTLNLVRFIAATDEAYAGLWGFLLQLDLIGTIKASGLSVDEPLWWMLADRRAARVEVQDHHYLRVLDVAAALEGRRYWVADSVLLEVLDPQGITDGCYRLTAGADGVGVVQRVDVPQPAASIVRLGVAELSAILLGGVSPVTLSQAGRLHCEDPARIARLFAGTTAPLLSFWY